MTDNREELINLVERLRNIEFSEEEGDRVMARLKEVTGDPYVTDYIFWAEPRLSSEDVVDLALGLRDVHWTRKESP
jgi:hypothetical protein